MLQLPFTSCKTTDLKKPDNSTSQANVIVICNHQVNEFLNLKIPQGKSVIYVHEDVDHAPPANAHLALKVPFSIYEFKHSLLSCLSDPEHTTQPDDSALNQLIGESQPIKKIKTIIRQVANSDSNILILGQSGTGKEIIASCIHQHSNRHAKPFIPLNCGAIPSELMESELFGHEKGAFTGAIAKRPGRFELANSGTLFLDEIADMPLQMQVKLLRVIQDKIVERVGSTTSIHVDVRIIAATNKQLENMIENNTFREDLYYRLNVIPIYVPTLHERISDIPLLVNNLLDQIRKRIPHCSLLSEDAIQALSEYHWPGNIRELANFIERMVVLYQDKIIDHHDVSEQLKRIKTINHHFAIPENADNFNIKAYLANIEQEIIHVALEKSNGIVSAAADYLNLGRTTLIEKMKKYKLLVSE